MLTSTQADSLIRALHSLADAQRELASATVFAAAYTAHAGSAPQSKAADAVHAFRKTR